MRPNRVSFLWDLCGVCVCVLGLGLGEPMQLCVRVKVRGANAARPCSCVCGVCARACVIGCLPSACGCPVYTFLPSPFLFLESFLSLGAEGGSGAS